MSEPTPASTDEYRRRVLHIGVMKRVVPAIGKGSSTVASPHRAPARIAAQDHVLEPSRR
jgi:hypothetical protein